MGGGDNAVTCQYDDLPTAESMIFVEPLVYNISRRHEFLLFNETPDPQILHTTDSQLSADMHPAQEENEFNTKFR